MKKIFNKIIIGVFIFVFLLIIDTKQVKAFIAPDGIGNFTGEVRVDETEKIITVEYKSKVKDQYFTQAKLDCGKNHVLYFPEVEKTKTYKQLASYNNWPTGSYTCTLYMNYYVWNDNESTNKGWNLEYPKFTIKIENTKTKKTCLEYSYDTCPDEDSYGKVCYDAIFPSERCRYLYSGDYKTEKSCKEDGFEWFSGECASIKYAKVDGDNFKCGDKLLVVGKRSNPERYLSVNGIEKSGEINISQYTYDEDLAKENCENISDTYADTINQYRYLTEGNNLGKPCGTEYFITTCEGDYCNGCIDDDVDRKCSSTVKIKRDKLIKNRNPKEYCNQSTKPTGNTITLIADGSVRFDCPNGLYTKSINDDNNTIGKCVGTNVKSFTLPNINVIGSTFQGWSTNENCSGNILKAGTSVSTSEDTTYYACLPKGYKEINGYRYLKEGAVSGVTCGSKYYITYCPNNDSCYGCANKDNCSSPTTISRSNLAESNAKICNVSTSNKENVNKDMYATINGDNFKCGDKLYVTICTDSKCSYSKVEDVASGGTINRNELEDKESDAKSACNSNELDENDRKCPSMETEYDNTSEGAYQLCYDEGLTKYEIIEKLESLYKCESGYSFDKTYVVLEDGKEDNCNDYICNETYAVRCKKEGNGVKPIVNISPAVVGSDNIGVISIKAKAFQGEINAYYKSEYYSKPTLSDSGWVEVNSTDFTVESTPGTVYIWVKDTEGNISNAVTATVFDNNNINNTLQKIALYDANGKIQTPSTVSYSGTSINSSKYVMMSNDLRNNSKVLADAFNPFAMEYKVEVSSPTLTVYATLTSKDAKYVDGYEPRTVNLNYGMNTILIKILDNEGKVRTYTILATRTDDRTSDNTLSDLNISVGDIKFNANVTDYKIEIPKNTKSVDVTSRIASNVASYVSGYEPGNVSITGDTTVKLIKVKSQTGSTRTYVLTFVKEGTDFIEDKTLQLRDLVIPGVFVAFESDVANYSFSVDYEMDSIDIKPVINDKNSFYTLRRKRKNESDYKFGSNIGVPLDVGENFIEIEVKNSEGKASYYRITVIRKEFGLGISNDTSLKDLRVLDYDIKFEPNKKDYTVRIKQEKSLVITAVPASNRAEVFIRGNDELSGFSTVRIKVVAENGEYETYSIDIKKDAFNKTIEIASIIVATVIIFGTSAILIINKKRKSRKEYFSE